MKKKIFVMLVIFLAAGLSGAQTLDEVLAKNYQARGGLDKLKAVLSIKMSGKIVIPDQGIEMPMVIWQKHPDKMRVESTFQEKVIVQAYDGRKAWWIMPFLAPGAQEMSQEQSQEFKEQADFENPLVVYKEKGYKLELLGKENLETVPVFKLKLTKREGREIYFYLDAAIGIELKNTMVLKSDAGENVNEIIFSDYKPVKDLLLPFHFENKTNGKTQAQLTLATIEINPVIDDAIFVMPIKKEKVKVDSQK
jgi:outer membrane lipoprotein-sorting protein